MSTQIYKPTFPFVILEGRLHPTGPNEYWVEITGPERLLQPERPEISSKPDEPVSTRLDPEN